MHDDELEVDEPLVRRLVSSQFPEFDGYGLMIVEPWGTDNAIWRLGDALVVRFPRIHWAAEQAEHEAQWLPQLGPHLPVAVPEPVAVGRPGFGYPYHWSIHRWLPGQPASLARMGDPLVFALDLARFVRTLQEIPADGAPPATARGRPLADYDGETRKVIEGASQLVDAAAALRVWEEALAAPVYNTAPVWMHGDLEGNCLVAGGLLSGVVDWSLACVGDPAVEIQVVWSPLFTEDSRRAFLEELEVDEATLARSRGWAVRACAALPYYLNTYPEIVERSRHKLAAIGVPLLP